MSRSKSSKLSAGWKLVQRHRVVRVTLKKIPVFDFLKFLFSNRKKIRPVARYFFLHWAAMLSAEPLKSRQSCLRKPKVVVLVVTVRGTFQRLAYNVSICVRAGLPKPRPVPDTERNKDTKTLDYVSTPLDANTLLCAGFFIHHSPLSLLCESKPASEFCE